MEAINGLAIEIGKCIVGPVKRQFNYLCCFNGNIQILRDEAQKLHDANADLKMRVDEEAQGRVIYSEVKTWLESASQSKDTINGIESKIPIVKKGRLNLISRYSLSRKAKKTAEALRELRNNCEFKQVSLDAPPALQDPLPLGTKEQFETRKKIEEDVMEALRDRNMNTIGLCGMGGIGKTTMAERIVERVKEEKLFHEVVMVVVSWQVDILKLQKSIADQVDLTLDAEDLTTREYKIRTRLRDIKRILIVVDNVWKYLELEKLGIPSENTSGRCVVLLTSRNRDVLEEMETQKIFGIKILCERESWLLFREKSGNCTDREDLHSVAKDITKECSGLPLALVTVGRALRNKKNRQLWDEALAQLRSHNPVLLPNAIAHVYKPIKLSYDSLESGQAKSLFLLCSMFKEDADINIEILTWFLMGLGMFESFRNLNEVRNRTLQLVEMLKDRFLLLDGPIRRIDANFQRFDSVRMHDCVRDIGIYVTSWEKCCGFVTSVDAMPKDFASWEDSYENCSWISISNSRLTTKFSVELKFPSLRLLSLERGEGLSERFFYGIKEICVLSMTSIQIESLPSTTQLLKSLKILLLFECEVKSISMVGELSNLEVLCCFDCPYIEDIPAEIGRLNRLRLLQLTECFRLRTIAPGVISSLDKLEELELLGNDVRLDFPFTEIKSLTKLTGLAIETNDVTSIAQEIHFPANVEEYSIMVQPSDRHRKRNFSFQKSMHLRIPGQINLGNWIKKLLRNTEFLRLEGDGANQVNFAELENVKYLALHSCSSLKKFVDTSLENLEEITSAKSNNYFFRNLRKLEISDCDYLLNLFPMSIIVRSNVSQLEKIKVRHCPAMEGIFYNDYDNEMEERGASHRHPDDLFMVFPKLTKLYLLGLSELAIQKIVDMIRAPGLKILQLESFDDNPIKLDCSAECLFSCFNNLVRLNIDGFNGIKNLMSLSVAGNLLCLKELQVWHCKMMLEVIADDEEQQQMDDKISLFPALSSLWLVNLDELRSFCQWKCDHDLEMPSLETVYIINCPKMETFTLGSFTTPKLEQIKIDVKVTKIQDLNEAIQQHFKSKSLFSTSKPSLFIEEVTAGPPIKYQLEQGHDEDDPPADSPESYQLERGHDEDDPPVDPPESHQLEQGEEGHGEGDSRADSPERYQLERRHDEDDPPVDPPESHQLEQGEEGHGEDDSRDHVHKGQRDEISHEAQLEVFAEGLHENNDCILFCSGFPSDYGFTRDMLVWQWMAQGFIKSETDEIIEGVYIQRFDSLLSSDYIVPCGYDHCFDHTIYKVGDKMRAFLQEQLLEPKFRKYLNSDETDLGKIEHLSLDSKEIDDLIFGILKKCNSLQTLIIHGTQVKHLPCDLFLKLKALKILNLSHTNIVELPSSVENLKELRYLDTSWTPISWLPESIHCLGNLLTLKLDGCLNLTELPKSTIELINLQHLVLNVVQLQSMPKGIGKLLKLRTLRAFLIGKEDGNRIGELKNMNKLKGSFDLLNLENVTTGDDAAKARLCDKLDLKKIDLRWSDLQDGKNPNEEEILESLQPPFGIQELTIIFYSGGVLPSWISNPSFSELVSLMLYGCRYCGSLPSFGELPSLKVLKIVENNEVIEINNFFCRKQADQHHVAFPKLEKLSFGSMYKLEKWTGIENGDFPSLRSLIVEYCPEFAGLPFLSHLNSLLHMEIRSCLELSCLPEGGLPPTLECLIIKDCPKLKRQCCNEQGEDWSKVAHVPALYIDGQLVSVQPEVGL